MAPPAVEEIARILPRSAGLVIKRDDGCTGVQSGAIGPKIGMGLGIAGAACRPEGFVRVKGEIPGDDRVSL